MRKNYSFILVSVLLVSSCATVTRYSIDTVGLSDRIRKHILYLASDELEGREAGTQYDKMAADYLAGQLRGMGVKAFAFCGETASDSLCFLQPFQATKTKVFPQSVITLLDSNHNGVKGFVYGNDFANFHDMMFSARLTAPMVFAGFGISAPEFNYDDYQFIDVTGKFVLVLDGEPASPDDDYFYGDIPSMYASALFYKRHRAKELGAKGLIVLTSGKLRTAWPTFTDYFKSGSLDFVSVPDDSSSDSERMPFVYATPDFFRASLARTAYDLDSIESWAMSGRNVPSFDIPSPLLRYETHVRKTAVPSNNVIGLIDGTDPVLKHEYVAIGAHYDHLGKNDKGEVFNGADDNASGVSGVLELARLLKANPPKRSVLIVFHGAEEKGLLGSEYLTMSETLKPFSVHDIVTYLNIDMIGRGHTDSIFVIGSDRISKDLKALIETVNRTEPLFHFDYAFDRSDDPNQYYYRSDHYNYARLNIPIAFFFDGMTSDYHQPTDDVDKINIPKIKKMVELSYRIIKSIGDRSKRFRLKGE